MHALHKILVSTEKWPKDPDRDEIISRARAEAENETDGYADSAFDWRETETAGRWADEYPENVLLGSEDGDRIVREIEGCKKNREAEIKNCLEMLGPAADMSIRQIAALCESPDPNGKTENGMMLYNLETLVGLLKGDYLFESYFYDASEYTARVTEDTIAKVKEHPENWALVLFDLHI